MSSEQWREPLPPPPTSTPKPRPYSRPRTSVSQMYCLVVAVGSLCVCLCVVDADWTRGPDMWAINPSNIKARDIRPGRGVRSRKPKAITPK
jgi:hypothetical protein